MRGMDVRVLAMVGALCGSGVSVATAQNVDRGAETPAKAKAGRPVPVLQDRMERLLLEWERVSEQNETLFARFTQTDRSPALVEPKVFEGQALMRKPNLACLDFQEVVPDKEKPVFSQRIVCAGDHVYQFLGATKQVFVYTLAADEQRRNADEGPLPFLFNMRVDRAKARYQWELLEERPAEAAKPAAAGGAPIAAKPPTYIIRIIPLQTVDQEEFSRALVMLNKETFLPGALQLFAPNGKDTKTFVFKNVERNGKQNPSSNANNFDGAKMAEKFRAQGYKVIVNPEGNGQPRDVARGAGPAQRGGLPVQRATIPKSVRPR